MKERRSIKSYVITVLITMVLSIAGTVFVLQANFKFIPKDEEGAIISNTVVSERLAQIDEWATSEFTYTGAFSKTKPRKVFGQRVPFADNRIEMDYEGIIKVGYVTEDIKTEVNNTTKTIKVTLSSPEVFDNYIKLDSLKIREENNMLNPLQVSDLPTYLEAVESDELSRAEQEFSIYDEAEKKAKAVISEKLSDIEGYSIVFSDSPTRKNH